MIQDFKIDDMKKLEQIKDPTYDINVDVRSPLYYIKKSIYDEKGNFVGSAFVHLTSEVTLVLDKDVSNLTRAKAVKEVFDTFNQEFLKFGIEDTHVFVLDDPKYEEFLINKFGFKRAQGTPLYRKVDHG